MKSKKQVQEWLNSIPDEVEEFGIDDGGLTLVAAMGQATAWLEIGGIPDPDNDDDSTIPEGHCLVCGKQVAAMGQATAWLEIGGIPDPDNDDDSTIPEGHCLVCGKHAAEEKSFELCDRAEAKDVIHYGFHDPKPLCASCYCAIGEEDHQDDCPNREPVTDAEPRRMTDVEHALNRIKAIIGVDDELQEAIAKLEKAHELLRSAVDHWAGRFESEEDINGADCVDWLAYFIGQATEIVRVSK